MPADKLGMQIICEFPESNQRLPVHVSVSKPTSESVLSVNGNDVDRAVGDGHKSVWIIGQDCHLPLIEPCNSEFVSRINSSPSSGDAKLDPTMFNSSFLPKMLVHVSSCQFIAALRPRRPAFDMHRPTHVVSRPAQV